MCHGSEGGCVPDANPAVSGAGGPESLGPGVGNAAELQDAVLLQSLDLPEVSGDLTAGSGEWSDAGPTPSSSRMCHLLVGDATTHEARVSAAMLTAAISGAVMHPFVAGLDDDTLRAELEQLARRFLKIPG